MPSNELEKVLLEAITSLQGVIEVLQKKHTDKEVVAAKDKEPEDSVPFSNSCWYKRGESYGEMLKRYRQSFSNHYPSIEEFIPTVPHCRICGGFRIQKCDGCLTRPTPDYPPYRHMTTYDLCAWEGIQEYNCDWPCLGDTPR